MDSRLMEQQQQEQLRVCDNITGTPESTIKEDTTATVMRKSRHY